MLDSAPLNGRFWASFAMLGGVYVLDFFDFFLIGFILAVIAPSWHLSYGQAALILYGSGVGAILGSLVWGSLGDVFGRKLQTVTGTLICGAAAGLIAILPTGAFVPLAILRIFVGFGLAAAITPALTIMVELTPTRWRSGLTSLFVVSASLGPLLASAISHAFLDALGWRGVAMFGLLPIVIGALVWVFQPESARWLIAKGRFGDARAALAKHLGIPADRVPLSIRKPAIQPRASLAELYTSPRLFWQTILIWGGASTAGFGYLLWGPTIIALTLHISVSKAAEYFVYVSASAMAGRLLIAWMAQKLGRRMLGIGVSFAAAALLGLAGNYNAALLRGVPVFVILVAAAAFFVEGGLGNITPYTIEQYGVRLGSRASGLGHAAAGVGKIFGPLVLALIAGTGNVVSPKATQHAVFPAFVFLASCMLLVALAFLFLARETHGRAIALGLEDDQPQPEPAAAAR